MVKEMQRKFDKYWREYSLILSCAVILDPRHKVKTVEYCFNKVYREEYAKIQMTKVITALYKCFEAYKKGETHDDVGLSNNTSIVDDEEEEDIFKELDNFKGTHCGSQVQKLELDLYLEEPPLDRNMKLDVLHFWSTCSLRYPDLSSMARDILTIPVSTVASESTFSVGRRVISPWRSNLKTKTIEALMCLRDWLRASSEPSKYFTFY